MKVFLLLYSHSTWDRYAKEGLIFPPSGILNSPLVSSEMFHSSGSTVPGLVLS